MKYRVNIKLSNGLWVAIYRNADREDAERVANQHLSGGTPAKVVEDQNPWSIIEPWTEDGE